MKQDGRSLDHATLEDIRLQALERMAAGESAATVAAAFGMHRSWAYKVRAMADVPGSDSPAQGSTKASGRPRKLDAAQERRVFRWLDGKSPGQYGFEGPLWTRAHIGALIVQRLGVDLSLASIAALLARMGLGPQTPLQLARERDPKAMARWERLAYPSIVRQARRENAKACFLGALTLQADMRQGAGAATGGGVCVVHPGGGLWFATYPGEFDEVVFVALLRKLMRGLEGGVHLVLDEHPAYHSQSVRTYVDRLGGKLRLHFLPNPSADTVSHASNRSAKRTRVLNEAAKALNRRGISQTSFAEIASNVGVSRAALYYYFEDQEDLVFQCYRRSCEEMARCLNEATRGASDTLAVIDGFIEAMLSDGQHEVAALGEAAFLREAQRNTILGLYEGIVANLAQLLDEGARKGQLRPCRSTLVASTIIGLISWVTTIQRWRTTNSLSVRDLTDTVKNLLHEGIATDRSAPVPYIEFSLSPLDLPAGRVFDAQAMGAARQEALLAAASWLFNLKGVDATSLEEIALRVGVTKRVIYHNMGDKQTVVTQCYLRAFRFHESICTRVDAYEGTRLEAFCAGAHALAEACLREDIAPFRALTGDEALPSGEHELLQTQVDRLTERYIDTLKRGQAEGSMRRVNARAAVSLFPGFVEWLPKWLDAPDPAERASVARELTDLYQRGLRRV
jgi:AcrR family transcriptional regulator/transposase